MSSSGLIYAVIVGAWAAYLVPMWLRRQDELNEARPTERFSTAIRLLSGRAGMERRYAKDLRARSADEGEHGVHDPDAITDSVDVRAFAVSQTRPQTQAPVPPLPDERPEPGRGGRAPQERGEPAAPRGEQAPARGPAAPNPAAQGRVPAARRSPDAARRDRTAQAAAERARRSKVLARRRRTITMLFLAFTLGAVVAAVGGLAFLWAPGVPAVLLSAYIAYLRSQERRRFAYQMDRRQAEVAAQRLRERRPRRRPAVDEADPDEPEGPEAGADTDPGLSALAADRRALVEQTDHAEWVDQQRERSRRPGQGGDSWDPVPVPLPTYVTAPVAPRASGDVDLGAPDTWSSARSSAVPAEGTQEAAEEPEPPAADDRDTGDGRTDARRAASARRSRERGRTPLFDQYEDGDRPKAANE
ncbi:gephyrin-like molybdotransferase receptor GlpR [Streptomyces pseudogriseolus]|uniref:Gephyrin-like molybdotransferase receptor GlpR n=3 Tax=Streptomyces TaxID=1883 RepID=A0AB39NNV6_9ACTN|nr:gephyrin-like molybdotransferase receptor GlpR [Streptomyces sp. NRRL S-1314]